MSKKSIHYSLKEIDEKQILNDSHPVTTNLMALFFAMICSLSVANVYYAQPLLEQLASDFGIAHASIGIVITLTQTGSVLALFFVVPLGDILKRRCLITVQSFLLCISLVLVGFASSSWFLYVGMLAVGLFGTAMTQGMIAYAASYADASERGRVVGITQGGVVIGLLLARTFAGTMADWFSWRAVYFTSAVLTLFLLLVMRKILPEQAPAKKVAYHRLLSSMLQLLLHNRTLQIRGLLALLIFTVFSIFWSALVLPLSTPPYSYSLSAIGGFGLVGVVGALGAVNAGSLADRGLGQRVTGISLVLLLISWLFLSFMSYTVWLLIIGIILLDLGGQAIHVVNQSLIFSEESESHSRIVGCYMMFYAVGSALGAVTSTYIYSLSGWGGVCVLGAGVSFIALLFWMCTLRGTAKLMGLR